jgi:hypothetical protein
MSLEARVRIKKIRFNINPFHKYKKMGGGRGGRWQLDQLS